MDIIWKEEVKMLEDSHLDNVPLGLQTLLLWLRPTYP